MSAAPARLVLAGDRRRVAPLDPTQPLTIGRASTNRLCLASAAEVSEHHAVVRHSRSHGWLICDWQSRDGTYLEGARVQQCRPLSDGDEIRLGRNGPLLVFELTEATGVGPQPPTTAGREPARTEHPRQGAAPAAAAGQAGGGRITIADQTLPVTTIRSAAVRSELLYPQIFSWWLLLCLGGLLLLPFPLLFWPLQIAALAGWILLGSRKEHTLVVELRDGQALRHAFANRRTALAHRNGIRKAIGEGGAPP
ncbi:MAG: hypothetical protein RLZZ611_419 [Cyanobacteriota bacterium]